MTIEQTRRRLMRRVVFCEVAQDTCYFAAGIAQTFANYFTNLAMTAKVAEVDAAKQYRDLTGTAVREIDGSLMGARAREDGVE